MEERKHALIVIRDTINSFKRKGSRTFFLLNSSLLIYLKITKFRVLFNVYNRNSTVKSNRILGSPTGTPVPSIKVKQGEIVISLYLEMNINY